MSLEVVLLFTLDGAEAPELYQRLGSERAIKDNIVLNAMRNGVRDAVATKSINEIFSPDRREIAADMRQEIQAKAGNRIEVVDVFVRDIQAPPRVREAIEARIEREQQVEQERIPDTRSSRSGPSRPSRKPEASPRRRRIISEGLTPEYLTFKYIEQLGTLPAGSVVYVPTEGGVPLMRQIGGGNN